MVKKYIGVWLSLVFFFSSDSHSANPQSAFLLADVKSGEVFIQEGDINQRLSPCSTFKIPLALMGYEAGILKNAKSPKWVFPGDEKGLELEVWKGEKNPSTWMKYSVVWYSQELIEKLGLNKFKHFIEMFDYGNQDISADAKGAIHHERPHCWLGSSLKISPKEQFAFINALVNKDFPLSDRTYHFTKQILYREDGCLPQGWKLFAKTGYGRQNSLDDDLKGPRVGWFVGWIEKGDKTFVFVASISNQNKKDGSYCARDFALQKLTKWIKGR